MGARAIKTSKHERERRNGRKAIEKERKGER